MNEDWMIRFQNAAETKHRKGVWEHRGGDESLPYKGDRRVEYCEEQLDSANYLYGLMIDGTIGATEFEEGWMRHFQQWWWMMQVMER